MNAQEYEELAAACDALLRSDATDLGRIALPVLHLINEHPTLLVAYEPLLAAQSVRQQSAIEHLTAAASSSYSCAFTAHDDIRTRTDRQGLRILPLWVASRHCRAQPRHPNCGKGVNSKGGFYL